MGCGIMFYPLDYIVGLINVGRFEEVSDVSKFYQTDRIGSSRVQSGVNGLGRGERPTVMVISFPLPFVEGLYGDREGFDVRREVDNILVAEQEVGDRGFLACFDVDAVGNGVPPRSVETLFLASASDSRRFV